MATFRPDPLLPSRIVPTALLLTAFLSAPSARAGGVDITVGSIEVNQAIQTGSTPLVGGRATFVRVAPQTAGSIPFGSLVDGLLRVYIGGEEIPGSPIYSDNGPIPLKSTVNKVLENDTLNFVLLAPQSTGVVFEVEINPAGPNFITETNPSNNTSSTGNLNFQCKRVPTIAYSPIDYRPSGGTTPNLPNPGLIKPGIGDNFVQGIYPTKDWYYRRTDAPSKLWTSSLSSGGSSLLNSLNIDLNLMSPKPDFIYGWVPGSLPYNGQAQLNGKAGMGNTQTIRHQRTFAHELGHNFGLGHNSSSTSLIGVDVEHHLNETLSLGQIKGTSLKDIMVGGQLTNSAWVRSSTYNFFFNDPVLNCSTAISAPADLETLLIAALLDRSTGALDVTDVITFQGGELTEPASPRDAEIYLRAYNGGVVVYELPVSARTSADECEGCRPEGDGADADADVAPPVGGFVAVLPAKPRGLPIDRIDLVDATGALVASEVQSSAAPQVAITAPAPGGSVSGEVRIAWTASDADGDDVLAYVRYSPDGVRMVPLANGVSVSEWFVDLGQLPAMTPGAGYFEVLVSDGLNTTSARTRALVAPVALGGGNAPFVNIVTPDHATTYRKGGTVILHSSGWDLEDGALDGTSIVWTSNIDGVLANGRLTSVSDLSVGTHVITVRATDSGGQQQTDTNTITIVDRGLPDDGTTVCQTDLGFGGPGNATLSVCGGDLSTGTSAEMLVTGATANQSAFIFVGLSSNPTPLLGGTLVPVPVTLTVTTSTNAAGEILFPVVPGGNGPFSVYAQVVYVDGAQVGGVGITNAVRIDVLP